MVANMDNEKSLASHTDAVDSANTSEQDVVRHVHSANEEIVHDLQTSGEEVGMTWRTTMAAIVSLQLPSCLT
jgi:hypothetical protein